MVASGSGQGGSWHLALAGLMQVEGIPPNSIRWVPATGAATALTDLAAGGVEFVVVLDAGGRGADQGGPHPQPRLHVAEARREFPGRADDRGGDSATSGTRACGAALAGPRGLPKDIATQYETAIKKIWDSAEFQEFMTKRGFDLVYMDSAKFAEFMKTDNEDNGKTLKSLGLAKK